MKYDVISFDLQGTLSDDAFSDEFWLEILPQLYAKNKCISVSEAKEELKKKFNEYGRYDYRYYSLKYWLQELKLSLAFDDILQLARNKPHFFEDTLQLLKEIKGRAKLIIASSTTKEFIMAELGENTHFFSQVFSSLDDFNIAGKPKDFYEKIAAIIGVPAHKILHIGDSKEMDIDNASIAGFKTFYFDKKLSRPVLIGRLREHIFA